MKRSDELVQFISRTFGAATVALLLVAGVFLALFLQRNSDEGWAGRSREVARLARELEIAALRRESVLRGHVVFGAAVSPAALRAGNPEVRARLDSLRSLTAGHDVQQRRAERIASAFVRWDSILTLPRDATMRGAEDAASSRSLVIASQPVFAEISGEVHAFLAREEQLYEQRRADAHRLDRVILGLAILSFASVLVILFLLRRRLLAQAHQMVVNTAALDLRNAQLIDQTGQLERTVDALQASETRFRTLVDSLHDVVFTLGHEKRYTGMFGGSTVADPNRLDVHLGRTAAEILGPEAGRVHMDAADRALKGESFTYDWSIEDNGTRHFYTATVSPLRGRGGKIHGVVGINRDVTGQVVREKALAEAREQLRQAQRLDALGQLAGGVAHDFNNLLTVIMTYAAIMSEEADPASDEARSLEEIRLASERAAALTRQLLAFSRRQVLNPRAIDLNDIVREVERMLRRLMPPDIVMESHLGAELGLVMADPGQMEQVLVNLAINARDAMPDGGRLTITTANVDRGDDPANGSRPSMREPHVLVNVTDTGVGMSPETVAKVFEPFFTTKGFGKGTGLGLATVHGIIEQSGGCIRVQSEPGRGTTFSIRLPRLVDATPVPAAPKPAAVSHRGSERVMLIDDNEELRRVVKRMLVRAGYQVVEAGNGAAAIAQLDRGVAVDVVISDVMMPEMGGKAVVDAIRQRHRTVRLLLISGYNYDTALRGMAQRGDISFIEKPFTAEGLLQKLREVLDHPEESGIA